MRRACLSGLAGLLGLMLLAGSSFGDDQAPTKQTRKQKHTANKPVAPEGKPAATTADAAKAHAPHLPAGFGKVNLTPEQHKKAQVVMDKYSGQIKQLRSQIDELMAKRNTELNALLDDTQKQSLAEAKANTQKMRDDKKTAGTKTATASAKKMTKTGAKFKIDPEALKALHDKAVGTESGQASAEKHAKKSKKHDKKTDQQQTTEEKKDQPATPEKSEKK
jgi:hypothetical protein